MSFFFFLFSFLSNNEEGDLRISLDNMFLYHPIQNFKSTIKFGPNNIILTAYSCYHYPIWNLILTFSLIYNNNVDQWKMGNNLVKTEHKLEFRLEIVLPLRLWCHHRPWSNFPSLCKGYHLMTIRSSSATHNYPNEGGRNHSF